MTLFCGAETAFPPRPRVVDPVASSDALVVPRPGIEPGWTEGGIGTLAAEQVARLLEWKAEIVLLGSGTKFAFPDPAALAPLYGARVGVEVMDTRAACRTYNILLAEGRNVIAALIVD